MDQSVAPRGYRVVRAALTRPLRSAYDIDVDGVGDIPAGPAILAANHRSFMDSIFLALVVDRPVTFLAKAEYFDKRSTAWFFRSTGQIALRRGSPAGARQALDAARGVLTAGGLVGLYPEGTRSRDGLLHRGQLGAARLAVSTGAPIVPVGLVGTDQVQAPGQWLPRIGRRIDMRFGAPIWPEPDALERPRDLRDLTDRLMADIAALCGTTPMSRAAGRRSLATAGRA